MDSEPDVICLTETFIKSGSEHTLKIANYELATYFSRVNKRGGVCILVKKGLAYKELVPIKSIAIVNSFECCGIELTTFKIRIICVYRTPNSDVYTFFSNLESLLHTTLKNEKKKLIVAGDLNIDILKPNKDTQVLMDILSNNNLKMHITEPTRRNACLDHIISNIDDAVGTILPLGLSDHETGQIISFFEIKKEEPLRTWYVQKRDYSNENMENFRKIIQSLTFTEIYESNNPNFAFNTFQESLKLLFSLCFPIRKIKMQTSQKVKWVTKGLRISCRNKRYLRLKYYKDKTKDSKTAYKKYSHILKKCIIGAQRTKNSEIIKNSKNICRTSWNLIKEKSVSPPQFIKKIKIGEQIITQPTEIANMFNSQFIDHGSKDKNRISTTNYNVNAKCISGSIFLNPVSATEVKNTIAKLKNTNAEGEDGIATKVIKYCKDELSDILMHLINLSYEHGFIPDGLKTSIIRPLHKKGEKDNIENYRPIALIPILSKVYEKTMHKRLYEFLVKHNVIRQEQNGFQKNKSTTLAAFNLVNEIVKKVDSKLITTALFFDMTKAFDFVSHKLLLTKLHQYGIRGKALKWIESYLQDRQQCVEIASINSGNLVQNSKSAYKINRYGVPQGSVLGPLLFLLYINDITSIISYNCVLFADDISVIVTSKKSDNFIQNHRLDIHNTINSVVKWLDMNNLQINLSKTNYLNFNNIDIQINYNGHDIEQPDQVTFLGLIIDKELNWKAQIDKICKKTNSFVYVINRLRKTSNRETALMAYHGYIGSLLRYGLIIWGRSTDSARTFIAQKKCIRAICGAAPLDSCRPLFKQLNILPLPCQHIYDVACFVRQHENLFTKASDVFPRNTRNRDRLVDSYTHRTALYEKSSYLMSIRIYNKLPQHMKLLPFAKFKKELRAWLMVHSFYSLNDYLTTN